MVSSDISFYTLDELSVSPVMEEGWGWRQERRRKTDEDTYVQKAGEKSRLRLHEEPILEVVLDKEIVNSSKGRIHRTARHFIINPLFPTSAPLSSKSLQYSLSFLFLAAFTSFPYIEPHK